MIQNLVVAYLGVAGAIFIRVAIVDWNRLAKNREGWFTILGMSLLWIIVLPIELRGLLRQRAWEREKQKARERQ